MWLPLVSKVRMIPVQFSPIRYPNSRRPSFDSLDFMENPIGENHCNGFRQYRIKSSKLTLHVWRPNFRQTRRSIRKSVLIFFFVFQNFATFYKSFPKHHSFTFPFSVFTYSSNFVLISEYVNGNRQHCVIHKVRNYHDEVEKAVADFHVSKLKEYWLKMFCSLRKGW